MIELHDIVVEYGNGARAVRAVDGVSLKVPPGGSLALIGPSGCGKTSLLYAIAGLLKPAVGEVTLEGKPLSGVGSRVALILQNAGLLPWKTVWQNANLSLLLAKEYPKKTATAALEEMGLLEVKDRYPTELSEGMKRRVGIARALATSPTVMLMDEPLASLDTLTKERIQDLFLTLWRKHRFSLILVTHDIEEAAFLGERIAVLSDRPARIKAVVDNPGMGELDYRGQEGGGGKVRRVLVSIGAKLRDRSFRGRIMMYAASVGILLLAWEIASLSIEAIKGRAFLPNPVRAIAEMVRLGPLLFKNFWISAWRLVMAILIAFFTGYPLGLLIGHERRLDQLISPMIYILYPIPQVAFILLLFLIFGIGSPVKVTIVAIALFFQLLVSARGAAKQIEEEYVTSVLSAGASRWQVYWHVILPATLPSILTSLRVSVGLGMAFLYIAETTGSFDPRRGGLGPFIKNNMYSGTQAFAGILAMAILGLALYIVIELIERFACRWKYVPRRPS